MICSSFRPVLHYHGFYGRLFLAQNFYSNILIYKKSINSQPFYLSYRFINTQSLENKDKKLTDEVEPESKVETTIKALKEEKKKLQEPEKKNEQLTKYASLPLTLPTEDIKDIIEKPLKPLMVRIWEKIKHECVHYYHGFRLLGLEIKISSGLLWQVLNGHTLTRRERKQFLRTVSDLFRLIPFLVFVIVPFMEFLLPVALKLFPNMLPSTFHADPSADKLQKQLKARLQLAKFLQETIEETALQYKKNKTDDSGKVNAFVDFMEKARKGDISPSNEEIIKFSRLFEDEFTLDTLNRDQLVAMCKILQLKPIGNTYLLRFQLNTALKSLKQDDLLIRKEGGVNNLSVVELQAACRARGMRALGLPESRLKQQLNEWLQLHLDHDIPASLLLLSRTIILTTEPAKVIPSTAPPTTTATTIISKAILDKKEGLPPHIISKPSPILPKRPAEILAHDAEAASAKDKVLDEKTDILKKAMAALPKAAEEQAKLRAAEIEGVRVDPKTMADVLKKESDAIKQEKAEKAKEEKDRVAAAAAAIEPKQITDKEILEDKAPTIADKAKLIEDTPSFQIPFKEVPKPPSTISSQQILEEKISPQELKDIAQAVEKLGEPKNIAKEIEHAKEMVQDIKEDLKEYREDIEEAKILVEEMKGEDVTESKSAIRLAKSVDKILGKADKIVEKLETESKQLDEKQTKLKTTVKRISPKIEDDSGHPSVTGLVDSTGSSKRDPTTGKMVEIANLVNAIKKSAKIPIDDARLTKLAQMFDEDKDGRVNMEHVLEAIDIMARENVNLDMKQIRDIVKMLKSEDKLEEPRNPFKS